MRRCPNCEIKKRNKDFGLNKSMKDGLQSWCKPCKKISNLKSYIQNIPYYRNFYDLYRKNKGLKVLGRRFNSKYNATT